MKETVRLKAYVLVVVLVALALRLWNLQFQSLWWDEGVSIYLSGAGLAALTTAKDFGVDLHPPLYHVVLALWRLAFGPSVFSMRLLSVFAGTATIPLTYSFTNVLLSSDASSSPPTQSEKLRPASPLSLWERVRVRESPGTRVAVVAALLAAFSPIDVYYSQETRMYALLPALGLLSLLATLRVVHRGQRGDWALWVLANVVGLYVYYYLGLLTLAEAAFLLGGAYLSSWERVRATLRVGGGVDFRAWLLAQVAVIVAYLPWLVVLAGGLRSTALALPTETEVHLTVAGYLYENWQDFTVGFDTPTGTTLLLILWAALAVVGVLALGRRSPGSVALVVGCAAIALGGAGAVLLFRPFFYPRFILFLLGPLWSLTALGLASLPRPAISASILALALLVGNSWTLERERTTARSGIPDDYRVVLRSIQTAARTGDVVLCGYPWQAGYVEAYLGQAGVGAAFVARPTNPASVGGLVGSNARGWVFGYDPSRKFVDDPLERILGERDPTLFVDQFGDSRARLFGPASAVDPVPLARLASFGTSIDLVSASVSGGTLVRPGGALSAVLRWRASAAPAADYKVFVHVLGPDGKVRGQVDAPPVAGGFPTSQWVAGEVLVDRYGFNVDTTAPPGDYQIEVGLYQADTGARLVVGPLPEPNNRVVIGTVHVEG